MRSLLTNAFSFFPHLLYQMRGRDKTNEALRPHRRFRKSSSQFWNIRSSLMET